MKKGKSVKLNLFSSIKTSYGTVDSKNFKSLYINIQSWVSPKKNYEGWNRIVSSLCRDIKLVLNDSINDELFYTNYIVDLDLRTSGLMKGKKSFFNLEITLYTKSEIDFKTSDVKDSVKKIIKDVFRDCIIHNRYFDFSSSKTEKEIKVEI